MRPFDSPPLKDTASAVVEVVSVTTSAEVPVDGKPTLLSAEELNGRAENTRLMLLEIIQDRSTACDVSRYFWQNRILVDPLTRPRSFPRFILDAEYSADSGDRSSNTEHWDRQMAMLRSLFVHEQIHLFVGPINRHVNPQLFRTLRELKSLEPLRNIPISETLKRRLGDDFARAGTDLHIVVNWLELQANKRFLGDSSRAKELVASIGDYRDIYRAVSENDDQIAQIMEQPPLREYLIEK